MAVQLVICVNKSITRIRQWYMNWCTHYTINDKQNYPIYKLKLLAIKFNHWRFVQPSQDLIIGLYVFKPTNCLQSNIPTLGVTK